MAALPSTWRVRRYAFYKIRVHTPRLVSIITMHYFTIFYCDGKNRSQLDRFFGPARRCSSKRGHGRVMNRVLRPPGAFPASPSVAGGTGSVDCCFLTPRRPRSMFEVSKNLFANEMQMKCDSPPAPFHPRHSLAMRRRRRRRGRGGGGCGAWWYSCRRGGAGICGRVGGEEEEEGVAAWVGGAGIRGRVGGEEEEEGVAAWVGVHDPCLR